LDDDDPGAADLRWVVVATSSGADVDACRGLTHAQVSHFRAFGYVVLRGLLSADEAARLRAEVAASLRDAMASASADDPPPGLTAAMMSRATPLATSLVADDARLWQAAHVLLGMPTVPTNGEGISFRANASWHADMGRGLPPGLKMLAYLDPSSAASGALAVLPGSHVREAQAAMWDFLSVDPLRQGFPSDGEYAVPAKVVDTSPGDVVAFHSELLHSSFGGAERLAWNVQYLPYPSAGDVAACRDVAHLVRLHAGTANGDRSTAWDEWAADAHLSESRAIAVERLRRLGVFDGRPAPGYGSEVPDPSLLWSSGRKPGGRTATTVT
jgi:hypothetical protein